MATELEDARSDRDYCNGFDAGWNAGYAAGVDAARRQRYRLDDDEPSWVASIWRSINRRRAAALAVIRRGS